MCVRSLYRYPRVTDLSRESHPRDSFCSTSIKPSSERPRVYPPRETTKDLVVRASCRHVESAEFHGRRKFRSRRVVRSIDRSRIVPDFYKLSRTCFGALCLILKRKVTFIHPISFIQFRRMFANFPAKFSASNLRQLLLKKEETRIESRERRTVYSFISLIQS